MIKKSIFFTVVIVSSPFILTAQSEYNYFSDWSSYYISQYPVKDRNDKNIKQITITHQGFKRSGKLRKNKGTNFKKYDEKGRMVEFSYLDKHGVEQKSVITQYDQYGNKSYVESYKKGKLHYKTTLINRPNGDHLSVEKVSVTGKILFKSTWTYNADNCVTESVLYKKDGKTMQNKWTYSYFDKCQIERSVLYNSKGKIKNIWSYSCKQEGEKLEKKKDEVQVCRWEQSSADYITKVQQTFDEKGRIVKNVYRYTAKDSLIVDWCKYDGNDKLITKYTYDKSWDRQLSRTRYKKNGKQLWEVKYSYTKDGLPETHMVFRKAGRLEERTEYIYDSTNLLTELKKSGKKNRKLYSISLSYASRN